MLKILSGIFFMVAIPGEKIDLFLGMILLAALFGGTPDFLTYGDPVFMVNRAANTESIPAETAGKEIINR